MKICFLTSTSEWGGTEVHTVGLAETLEARGHEVVVAQLGHDVYRSVRLDPRRKIRIAEVPLTQPVEKIGWRRWLRILEPFRGDVCVFEKGDLDTGSLQLDLAARKLFRRYITVEQLTCEPMPPKTSRRHFHGLVPGLSLWWYQMFVMRHLRSLAPHKIVCVSDFTRRNLVEHYRFPQGKLVTIHNGFDAPRFSRSREHRAETRRRWAIPDDALAIGAVGRLKKVKGFDLAIELFRRLVAALPQRDMRLVLVGGGPIEQELERQAQAAGLDGRVLFPGFTERPWEAYPALDVFIMPSTNEGLPLALLEAMASGCCPIAMGVGGVPEVLTRPDVGWLVDPGDREGFYRAMESAARADPEGLRGMGERARGHVLSRFTARALFAKHADLIEGEFRRGTALVSASGNARPAAVEKKL
ncbi:MAG TPA: glycosyltransferase family 4 protein [Candidatus Acidoferrales bacterium]|nr:glycosyltransferase family 4 protein [Candidatus Acidoferrales bacterium]